MAGIKEPIKSEAVPSGYYCGYCGKIWFSERAARDCKCDVE